MQALLPVVPVELAVDVLRSEPRVRFVTIDLGSVYKIANADPVYWLVKAGVLQRNNHPRRPRGSQSGREKRRNESFQVRAEEPLGTDSHRTISKSSSRCRLLIGHKKRFVLLCPIGEHISWVLFVCSYTTAIARLVGVMHQRNARSQETFSLL